MKDLFVLLAIAVAIDLAYSCGTDGNCKDGWTKKGNNCYKFFDQKKKFEDAEAFCRVNGGHLACPTNAEQNAFIHQVANKPAWIGIHDMHHLGGKKGKEGQFRCSWNHAKIKFKSWHAGEPNDHGKGEDCTEIYFSNWGPQKKWNDNNCNNKLAFVCEDHMDK